MPRLSSEDLSALQPGVFTAEQAHRLLANSPDSPATTEEPDEAFAKALQRQELEMYEESLSDMPRSMRMKPPTKPASYATKTRELPNRKRTGRFTSVTNYRQQQRSLTTDSGEDSSGRHCIQSVRFGLLRHKLIALCPRRRV